MNTLLKSGDPFPKWHQCIQCTCTGLLVHINKITCNLYWPVESSWFSSFRILLEDNSVSASLCSCTFTSVELSGTVESFASFVPRSLQLIFESTLSSLPTWTWWSLGIWLSIISKVLLSSSLWSSTIKKELDGWGCCSVLLVVVVLLLLSKVPMSFLLICSWSLSMSSVFCWEKYYRYIIIYEY